MIERLLGKQIIIDGLDGIGKGVIEQAIVDFERQQGHNVEDMIFSNPRKSLGILPTKEYLKGEKIYMILTAEPTHIGLGKIIREEIIANNGRDYSTNTQIQAYSLDRLVLAKRTTIPAREMGIHNLQSRSVASSLTYQVQRAIIENLDQEQIIKYILSQEGNQLQLNPRYSPDLLIIPTIKDVAEVIERLNARKEKRDDCEFENLKFQLALKPLYESEWLKEIFERVGTKVVYLDAGVSLKHTKTQALQIYKEFMNYKPK